MARFQPALRRPLYANELELTVYLVAYVHGYYRRPRQALNAAGYPNAASRGYWDGFADNPCAEPVDER